MLSLAELQSAMRDVSLGGDAGCLADVIVADGFSHTERLNIHRNNTTILLSEALGATFSVVKKLVGEEFFDAVARHYIRAHPPQNPCLFEYGVGFPDYLSSLPQVAELTYLPDVAQLEWLWNAAFHAAEARVLTSADLAPLNPDDYGKLVFTPHPSLRLMRSDFPIKEIWDLNQCGVDDDATVSLDEGGQALTVLRPNIMVEMIELSPGGFVLAKQLADGISLEDAFASAQRAHPEFDPTPSLAILISAGAFTTHILKT